MSKFNIYDLSEEMLSVSREASAFATEESSVEIRPEHILRSLVARDSSSIRKLHDKLNENIKFETDSDKLMSRLSAFSNPVNPGDVKGRKPTNLSDTSEKLLHDAEMIAILGERPVSRADLFEAILLETFLSPENTNLDIVGHALGMRAASQGALQPDPYGNMGGSAPDPGCNMDAGYYAKPKEKVQEMKTKIYVKKYMKSVADKDPTWQDALFALNSEYSEPIHDYISLKVYLSMMANNLGDCVQSGYDAASDFFLTKLSDGKLYGKYVAFSELKPNARFRAYLIESANNYVMDFLNRKNKERKKFPLREGRDGAETASDFPSLQPGPATWMNNSEKKKIVLTAIHEFISKLLNLSSRNSMETNKLYFYIIYERLISPIFYGYEMPAFRKMAEKLTLITGRTWTLNMISGREITVMSKLKSKMLQALDN